MRTLATIVTLLVACWLAPGGRGEDPAKELTAEEREKLEEQAKKLDQEMGDLYRAGSFSKASEKAEQLLETRRRLYPKEKYPQGHAELAISLGHVGFMLQAQGEYARAEAFYRDCVEMCRALYPKGHPDLASSINNLGHLMEVLGDQEKAEALFREALDMRRTLYPKDKHPDGHVELAVSIHNVAYSLYSQGDYARAEPLFREAIEMMRKLHPDGHPYLLVFTNNLGNLLLSRGESARAEPFLRELLEMRRRLYPKKDFPQGHPDLALSINNLGHLLRSRGEYAKAEPLLREGLEMCRALYPKETHPNGHPSLATSVNNLGNLLVDQGENARAEPLFREAVEMRRRLYKDHPQGHPELALSIANLGDVLQSQGEYAKAEPLFLEAVEMDRGLYPRDFYPQGHPRLAHSIHRFANLLQQEGDYAKAEPLYREALDMLNHQAERLAATAPEPVALNFAATFPLTRDYFLSNALHRPDSDSLAYEAVWGSKAAVTRVYQRRHLGLVAMATDPQVKADYDRLVLLRRRREQLIMGPATRDAKAHKEKLDKVNEEIDEAEKGLLPRLPSLASAQELAQKKPDALQKLLPPDAVLIDLIRYARYQQDPRQPGWKGIRRTPSYAGFVVTAKEVRRVELGPAKEIEAAVGAWREAITLALPRDNEKARRGHERKTAELAGDVRRLVWEPVQKHIPAAARTVYLAPDGELTQLPWAALPGGVKGTVLLEEYALAVLPHGPFLLERLSPPPARPRERKPAEGVLLVGGVRYDDKPESGLIAKAETRGDAVVGNRLEWGYLKGSEEEKKLIAAVAEREKQKLETVGGAEAGVERLREELPRVRFAHIATHGFFADRSVRSVLRLDERLFDRRLLFGGRAGELVGEGARSPLVLSGLVLAGANREDTPEHGILSGDAIASLLLDDLELAVLSACETGKGDVAGEEGIHGLQRAFHIAGTKNVVASLWKVDDAATAALMVLFYRKLWEEKKPPIEALREAQLSIYRNPDLIPKWAAGERAPNVKGVRPPSGEVKPSTEPVTTEGTAQVKLWAAFTLSGLGK